METAPTRLWLIRHGEPEAVARGRCYGSLDIGLSEKGFRQSKAAACLLENEQFAAIYTSPRLRCKQTAQLLADGRNCQVLEVNALSEIDFGEFEGLTFDEIRTSKPELYQQWMETPTEVQFPNGESYKVLAARAQDALRNIRNSHTGNSIALITHGGVIRAMIAHVLGLPDCNAFRIAQSYAAISRISYHDDYPVVDLLNRNV